MLQRQQGTMFDELRSDEARSPSSGAFCPLPQVAFGLERTPQPSDCDSVWDWQRSTVFASNICWVSFGTISASYCCKPARGEQYKTRHKNKEPGERNQIHTKYSEFRNSTDRNFGCTCAAAQVVQGLVVQLVGAHSSCGWRRRRRKSTSVRWSPLRGTRRRLRTVEEDAPDTRDKVEGGF